MTKRAMSIAVMLCAATLTTGVLSACASDRMCEQSCSASYECGPGLLCFGGQCLPSQCNTCAGACNYSNSEGACTFNECR